MAVNILPMALPAAAAGNEGDLEMRRALAEMLLKRNAERGQNLDIRHPLQGVSHMADSLVSAMAYRNAMLDAQKAREEGADAVMSTLQGGGGAPATAPPTPAPQPQSQPQPQMAPAPVERAELPPVAVPDEDPLKNDPETKAALAKMLAFGGEPEPQRAPTMPNPHSNFDAAGRFTPPAQQKAAMPPAMGSVQPSSAPMPPMQPMPQPQAEVPRYGKPIGPENPTYLNPPPPPAAPAIGTWQTRVDVPPDGRTAAVRYNNPGAQYPSPHTERFGVEGYGVIGGGHKIAKFPSETHGAAANMDNFARNYRGMRLADAVRKWRGGNGNLSVPAGFDPNAIVDDAFLGDRNRMVAFFEGMAANEGRGGAALPRETLQGAFDLYRGDARGGNSPQPVRMAQAGQGGQPSQREIEGINRALRSSDPRVRQFGFQMAQRYYERMNPSEADRLEMEYKRAQIDKAREAGWSIQSTNDGNVIAVNPRTGEMRPLYQGGPKMTSADKKALYEAQDELPNLASTIETLKRAKEINAKVYSGPAASLRGSLGAQTGLGGENAKLTAEYDQILRKEAIEAMSKTLKGASTDREMSEFLNIIANTSLPPDVRDRALDRLISLAERHAKVKTDRIREMGGRVPEGAGAASGGWGIKRLD